MLICTNFSFLSISVFFKNWCKNKKATHSFKKCVAHCDKISRSEIKTGANKRKTPEKSGAFLTPHRYQCDVIIWCGQQDLIESLCCRRPAAGKRQSTGLSHLAGFESRCLFRIKKRRLTPPLFLVRVFITDLT